MPPRSPENARTTPRPGDQPAREVLCNISAGLDRVTEELREAVRALGPGDLPPYARDQLMWALVDLGRARTRCVGAARTVKPGARAPGAGADRAPKPD
jgi:hypothetical protein